MTAIPQTDRKYTEQEYFDLLAASDFKYEFHGIGNYYRLDQSVEVLTLGVTIPMETIYKGVELEDE